MPNVLIIDIETTGFSPSRDKIVEIGIVSLDLLTGNIEILFSEFIREAGLTKAEFERSWICQNNYINWSQIENANVLEFHFEKIQYIINRNNLGLTAFNKDFDLRFLRNRGFNIPKELRCPMKLATPIVNATGKRGRKYPTAEEAYRYFYEKDYNELHRGADDAYHEAKVVYALYKMGKF